MQQKFNQPAAAKIQNEWDQWSVRDVKVIGVIECCLVEYRNSQNYTGMVTTRLVYKPTGETLIETQDHRAIEMLIASFNKVVGDIFTDKLLETE